MNETAVEILGYVASVLVAWSLSMSNLLKLRWLNLAGAVAFTVYGLFLGAYPVVVVNAYIAVINVRFLVRFARQREVFELLEVGAHDGLLASFERAHGDDVRRFFPGVRWPDAQSDLEGRHAAIVLRNLAAAGLVIWRRDGDVVTIEADYATPAFRDFKSAEYLYRELGSRWRAAGVRVVEAQDGPAAGYFERAGFRRVDGGGLELRIAPNGTIG